MQLCTNTQRNQRLIDNQVLPVLCVIPYFTFYCSPTIYVKFLFIFYKNSLSINFVGIVVPCVFVMACFINEVIKQSGVAVILCGHSKKAGSQDHYGFEGAFTKVPACSSWLAPVTVTPAMAIDQRSQQNIFFCDKQVLFSGGVASKSGGILISSHHAPISNHYLSIHAMKKVSKYFKPLHQNILLNHLILHVTHARTGYRLKAWFSTLHVCDDVAIF